MQTSIIIRSSNHIADQARYNEMNNYDYPHKSSFDYSMRSETSYKNQKKP